MIADVCNAREQGLVGDGVANDQPALAALVERLGGEYLADHRPRVIYCPPGVYVLRDATTVWKSGISLIGAGAGPTRFVLENPGNPREPMALAQYTEAKHGANKENPLSDCSFAAFEIDGSRVKLEKYDPHAKGLDLQYMTRARFRDLYIHHTAATGLGCDHLQDSVIEDVLAVGCGRMDPGDQPGGAGIGIGIGGWGPMERLSINDCSAVGNGTNGIFVELQQGKWPPPRGIKVVGCHVTGNRFGISDWGADGLIVCACVMSGNLEAGFDVSGRGVASVAGRAGLLTDCVVDGNARDGVSIGNTPGPYTVRGNRISHNGRHGYHQHNFKKSGEPAYEIVVEANEIWNNALDGVRLEGSLVDAAIVGNRIRNNGRQSEAAYSGEGPGVTYTNMSVIDAKANWPVDGHKGKLIAARGMEAVVLSNTDKELTLAPYRPGATRAWKDAAPSAGTRYALRAAPEVRPGLALAGAMAGAWIRGNRIWDNQARGTQTHSLWTAPTGQCSACRIEDNE